MDIRGNKGGGKDRSLRGARFHSHFSRPGGVNSDSKTAVLERGSEEVHQGLWDAWYKEFGERLGDIKSKNLVDSGVALTEPNWSPRMICVSASAVCRQNLMIFSANVLREERSLLDCRFLGFFWDFRIMTTFASFHRLEKCLSAR